MNKPFTIILNGASSSGKSSIAKELVQYIQGLVWIAKIDDIHDMLHCEQELESSEAVECYGVIVQQFNHLLNGFSKTNYSIIVDQVFEQQVWLDGCLKALAEREPILIGVHCNLAELEKRERLRGDRKIGLANWQSTRIHINKKYDIEIDTTYLTPAIAAKEIAMQISQLQKANHIEVLHT
ncbi:MULTISPECIES: phosphotransferase-like protein [Deefgea]|uniref:Chloramphenicol phosphotransferase n=1 Tax=Deefgea chitinilytica TaxID=570276 RepID=A0ABS2CAT9_9NEIS|nr:MULTISPECIES: hypothetical protein [Deefgea]MBM5571265.1 hypothetical protein [Deefgea chitinilytica]MBM9888497.1 hypothetical protein [Deefgea sp. CFH1-16]